MATQSWCRRFFAATIFLVGLTLSGQLAWAQSSSSQGTDSEASDEQAPTREAAPIAGTMFTPTFEWVAPGKSGELLTKLHFREVYDSNLAASQSTRFSGTYSFAESDWRYSRQDVNRTWQINYRLGGRVYTPQFSSLNATSNEVELMGQQRVTQHFNVSVFQRYSSSPGTGFEESSSHQPFPVFNSPDDNIPFLVRHKESLESAVVFQYRTSARTTMQFGANYMDVKYSPSTLLHTKTYDPYFAIFHRMTASQTIGFGYMSQWILFPGEPARGRVDDILGIYENQLTPSMSIALFGGPGYVHQTFGSGTTLGLLQGTRRDLVGGVVLTKKYGRNNFSAKYNRSYSRGSAFLGTTLRQLVVASFERQLSQHLSFHMSGNYSQNNLAGFNNVGYASYRFQPAVRYQIRPRLWLTFSEAYATATGTTPLAGLGRNVMMFGLEYNLPDFAVEK